MRSRLMTLVGLLLLMSIAAAACSSDSPVGEATSGSITIGSPDSSDNGETDSQDETAEDVAPLSAPKPEAEADVVAAENDGLFPTVVNATATNRGDSWNFSVTLLSEYDAPERYADAWRVLDPDDNELGIRVLGHDHAGEQPFTRSHSIVVPDGTTTVYIEGRDQLNGWSGERFELTLS